MAKKKVAKKKATKKKVAKKKATKKKSAKKAVKKVSKKANSEKADRPILNDIKKKKDAEKAAMPKFSKPKTKITLGRSKYPRGLGTIGGLFTLAFSVWFLVIEIQIYKELIGYVLASLGIICGLLMLIAAQSMLRSDKYFRFGGTLLIITGILGLFPGFIVAPFLAILGGIMSKSKKLIEV